MAKTKARAEIRDRPSASTDVERRPEPAEREPRSGPQPAAPVRAAADLLPPPNGEPAPARAAGVLSFDRSGAASRARLMAGMQQTVGNARAGRMLAEAPPATGPPGEPSQEETPPQPSPAPQERGPEQAPEGAQAYSLGFQPQVGAPPEPPSPEGAEATAPPAEAPTETGTGEAEGQEEAEPEPEAEASEGEAEAPAEAETAAEAPQEAVAEPEGGAEAPPAAAPGDIRTMEDLQAAVREKTAAIPQPRVKSGGPAAAAIGGAAKKTEDRLKLVADRVPVEAAVPGPKPLPPLPEPTPENPVPHASRLVEESSGKPLANLIPPPLAQRPGGSVPKAGDQPISAEDLRRLRNIQEELPFPEGTEQENTRKALLDKREKMLAPPDPLAVPGAPLPIPQTVPAEPLPLPPDLSLQPAQVFARLLAEPDKAADDLLRDARKSLFPGAGGIIEQKFGDLGSNLKPDLTTALDARLRELADKGGVTVGDLQKEISGRQAVLRGEAVSSQKEVQESSAQAATQVTQAGQKARDAAASQAATLEAEGQDAKAAAGQAIDTLPIETRRDTLISTIDRRVARAELAYTDAGDERKTRIDSTEKSYAAAYQAAAQRDTLQLQANRPADADDDRMRGLEFAIEDFRDKQIEEARKAFQGFRTKTLDEVKTLKADLVQAGSQAREEIREWAATQSGETRSLWDRFVESLNDRVGQIAESVRALKEKTDRETAAAVNENLVLIDRLKKAADEGVREEELLANNKLSAEQRAIVSAFFESRGSGKAFDPIDAVAAGLRAKVLEERRGELAPKLEAQLFERATWEQLQEIGDAGGSPVDIRNKAHEIHEGLHGGLFGSNEVEKVMGALTGGLGKPHLLALRKKYRDDHDLNLEDDLRDQLSKGEGKRAEALLAGDKSTAISAELYTAMKEGFLGTGLGTDEKAIMKALRGLSAKERDEVIAAYERDFGRNLKEDLGDELDDWGGTKHDVERAGALLELDVAKADAIALDQAISTSSGSDTREGVEAVYAQIRSDVEEETKGLLTPAEREAEITRRFRLRENKYNEKYADTMILVPGPDGEYQQVRHGTLRESFERNASGAEKDLLDAYADNKRDAIDAAKIRIERTSLYTGDTAVLDVLGSQQDRALEDARAEIGPQKRMARMRELAFAEEADKKAGKPWTPAERKNRELLMEQNIEADIVAAAQVKSKQYMDKLQATYKGKYKESVSTVVEKGLSEGNNQKEAEILLGEGYLTPYQQFKFAVEGVGTREEMGKKALRGKTKKQIDEIKEAWAKEHPGVPFSEALDDFSGDDRKEVEISMMGTPESIDDVRDIERKRVEMQRPTNWLSRRLAGAELKDMEESLKDLEETHRKIKAAGADMPVEEQQRLLGKLDFQAQVTSTAVESHRESVAAVTESIANVASITVALAIGFGGAIFTGGASAALALAVISSIAATATSIGTRSLLLGSSYGSEELWTDIGMGAIDAVVSALTAGMGGRLLGMRQVATGAVQKEGQGAIRQAITKQLARFGNVGRVTRGVKPIAFLEKMAAEEAAWYSRFAADAISESIENTVQTLPTALISTAMDERTWAQGNPLSNLVSGVGGQLEQGLIMGLGVGNATKLISGAGNLLKGPRLGVDTHRTPPAEMSPHERAAHLKEYKEMYPGRTEADFDATIQRERAVATKHAEEEASFRDKVREELKGSPDAGATAGEVPITILDPVDFHRLQGLKGSGDAMVVVRDGQVHLVVKKGADLATVKQHAAEVKALAEPGTGGRTKNPADSLPKDLRNRVPIKENPKLEGATVEVHYDYDKVTGLVTGVRIEIGPNARAVDIHNHVATARALRSYSGLSGRVHNLRQKMAAWVGRHGEPPVGSAAFEARLEVEKLPRIIEERVAALQRAGGVDTIEGGRIALEIEHLRGQLAEFEQTVKSIEIEPGRGFVAARRLSPKTVNKLLSEIPDSLKHLRSRIAKMKPAALRDHLLMRSHYLKALADKPALAGEFVSAFEKLRGVPLVETHLHSVGALRPEHVLDIVTELTGRYAANPKNRNLGSTVDVLPKDVSLLAVPESLTDPVSMQARETLKGQVERYQDRIRTLLSKGKDPSADRQIRRLGNAIRESLDKHMTMRIQAGQTSAGQKAFFERHYPAARDFLANMDRFEAALKSLFRELKEARVAGAEIRHGKLHARPQPEQGGVIRTFPVKSLDKTTIETLRSIFDKVKAKVVGFDISGEVSKDLIIHRQVGEGDKARIAPHEKVAELSALKAEHNLAIVQNVLASPDVDTKIKEALAAPGARGKNLDAMIKRLGLDPALRHDPLALGRELLQRFRSGEPVGADLAQLDRLLQGTIADLRSAGTLAPTQPTPFLGLTIHAGEQIHASPLTALLNDVEGALAGGTDRIGHGLVLGLPFLDKSHPTGLNVALLESLDFRPVDPSNPHGEWFRGVGNTKETYSILGGKNSFEALENQRIRLLREISSRGVAIEVNPTSNIILNKLDPHHHPLREMLAVTKDLRITVNTDNPGIHATDLHTELTFLVGTRALSWPRAVRAVLESFDSRFGGRALTGAEDIRLAAEKVIVNGTRASDRNAVIQGLRRRYPEVQIDPSIQPDQGRKAFRKALRPFLERAIR